jgi:uncharacterized protein (DUF1778 family)
VSSSASTILLPIWRHIATIFFKENKAMARATAEERVPARMPTDVYERVVEAAHAVGATLNQFLVQSALDKANEILERERVIKLSAISAKAVFDLMENPPAPNENLKVALQRRERILCPE